MVFTEANMSKILLKIGTCVLVECLNERWIFWSAPSVHDEVDKDSNDGNYLIGIEIKCFLIEFEFPWGSRCDWLLGFGDNGLLGDLYGLWLFFEYDLFISLSTDEDSQ